MDYSSLSGTSISFHLLLREHHRREGRKKVSAGGLEDCSKAVFQIERSYCACNSQQLWLLAESFLETVLVSGQRSITDRGWALDAVPLPKEQFMVAGKGETCSSAVQPLARVAYALVKARYPCSCGDTRHPEGWWSKYIQMCVKFSECHAGAVICTATEQPGLESYILYNFSQFKMSLTWI